MSDVNTTYWGDRVCFNLNGMPHLAFIINHFDDEPNKADITYYLPKAQRKPGDEAWVEVYGVTMGDKDGQFQKL
jgi:hypothetical protein